MEQMRGYTEEMYVWVGLHGNMGVARRKSIFEWGCTGNMRGCKEKFIFERGCTGNMKDYTEENHF